MLETLPVKQIGEGIFEFSEFGGPSMFLIEGSERALLIDAGIGIGNLKKVVEKVTAKPNDVLLTHNHRDHVGNAPLFPVVHMFPDDLTMGPLIRAWTSLESRMRFAKNNCLKYDCGFFWNEEDLFNFEPNQEPRLIEIPDGYVFDLGNRQVTCWRCPGHTAGSMVAIDSKTGTLFCGDSCNRTLGLCVRPQPGVEQISVETAYNALMRINSMDFNRKSIYNSHSDYRKFGSPLSQHTWENIIEDLQKILNDDYVVRREWIQNIDLHVDTAVFDDVEIQFHTDNIHNTKAKG